jgi:hypothetical protein
MVYHLARLRDDFAAEAITQARSFSRRAQYEDAAHASLNDMLDEATKAGAIKRVMIGQRRDQWSNNSLKSPTAACSFTGHVLVVTGRICRTAFQAVEGLHFV